MMFSTRTMIWIVFVILLLPSDEKGKQDLYNKAHAALGYAKQACRQVETCATFNPSWNSFAMKARTGVDLIGDLVASSSDMKVPEAPRYGTANEYEIGGFSRNEPTRSRPQASFSRSDAQYPRSGAQHSRSDDRRDSNTLNVGDLIPTWREPKVDVYASR